VKRDQFDYKLTRLAYESGAMLLEGEEVVKIEEDNKYLTVKTNLGHRFSSRYLIGADGIGSRVARFIGSNFGYRIPLAIQKDIPYKDRGSSRVDLQACKLGTGRRFTTS
jgi:Dehydrogenases (flavoproteins)